ncbi:clustered mitochondria-domain-containing protein [Neohortaea acidophila]|uniref:Clustered mitochondria protein homolog n=1 Tax=Neohortaea acidophila TaxID=245834 RepID=A0A6A6Q4H6_9PEZI|nr:clustered mitochondria-domain-containing protein [Neohortaea acidophila]KAF2486553.1 clustered mitochondria-domain-containing protein [Neohortaea acidophila]
MAAEAPSSKADHDPIQPNGDVSPEQHATSQTDAPLTNGSHAAESNENGDAAAPPPNAEKVFQLTINLPHAPYHTQLMVSTQEQVQDIRQSIIDTPQTSQYSCFHLEHNGKRINDFVELSEVADIAKHPEVKLVEDPYTEAQARMHIVRVRELIGAAGNRTDLILGADAGSTLCDDITLPTAQTAQDDQASPIAGYDLSAPGSIAVLASKPRDPAPKTVKSLSLSSWNPPPYHLRMRGHLLYLQVTTLEGEQHYITSSVCGFYVNKSTNNRFDASPRNGAKSSSTHSLMALLSQISPAFDQSLKKLQEHNAQRDPLASYQPSNALPAAPWLVPLSKVQHHQSDITRTQEPFLLAGADNAETLRDWNEEFQSTRELPKETVQDRVFRERLTSKLFAEYTEAAVRGAVLVARGEVQPLNPTEAREAQIFVYNNVFYSFGADGVGTFTSDGGDEAARVATGKDVHGVKAVNQLDITGLFTAGTVVVDYLGKRIVGQSIVPGIFKQREPGENQIDYGGVEGKDVVATLESFVQPFSELSKATRVKRHAVWDKEGKKHDLEASVETKGLLGTDGRKYILDLYRLTPLDISWVERYREEWKDEQTRYPHRMTVLRTELVESYRISKLREYIAKELDQRRANKAQSQGEGTKELTNGSSEPTPKDDTAEATTNGTSDAKSEADLTNGDENPSEEVAKPAQPDQQAPQETVDVSGFAFSLNPDVYCGQQPQTDEEKAELEADEVEVRAVGKYLLADVIPRMVREIEEGDVGFPMDGQSLTREMHKRGINVRYLGEVVRLCGEQEQDKRVQALCRLCKQEMISRAFKHVANAHMKTLPPCVMQSCVSHLLNCLLGAGLNAKPEADVDNDLKQMYGDVDFAFEQMTPEKLAGDLKAQIALRFRHDFTGDLVQSGRQLHLLREVLLKLGLQLEAKEYQFDKQAPTPQQNGAEETASPPQVNGAHAPAEGGKKKKKKAAENSPARASHSPALAPTTFHPENVVNIVPVVKEAAPRSVLAEEALDAGRMGLQQDQKELGQELLFESLSLHEQIYGILHPEVARVYHALSTLYFNLDEKAAAVELAKKAVIISERTLGVDNVETILAYLNLSILEHGSGNTMQALAYARHALDLQKVVFGPRHPDSLTTLNNIAIMLQLSKKYGESRGWFEAALEMCEEVSSRPSQAVGTATLLFQLAQSLAFNQEPKAAMARMRESYNIFKTELGPEHPNTKEAENLLDILTNAAVSQAKHQANIFQNRKLLLRNNGRAPMMGMRTNAKAAPAGTAVTGGAVDAAASHVPAGTAATDASLPQAVDQRSVDELLKYINGETTANTSTPKKKPANPKRRR